MQCKKDIIVYRGTNDNLNSNSFISTSLSKYYAKNWLTKLHKIIIPKNSFIFSPLLIDNGVNFESKIILLPGTFDYIKEQEVFLYNGKSKDEVMELFLKQLKIQKDLILSVNNEAETFFDDAFIDYENNRQIK